MNYNSRKRSRSNSSFTSSPAAPPGSSFSQYRIHSNHGSSTPNSNGARATTSNRTVGGVRPSSLLDDDDHQNQRLLRLNVGGYPYDVVRTSLPLLETMMTDRWLSSCLVDSDGRIFLDRDGDAFGDILRYFRGGIEFLMELVHIGGSGGEYREFNGGVIGGGNGGVGGGNAVGRLGFSSRDRLRRLRIEADYYGLHQLVHDIDVVTIGEKVVFSNASWARVAGACLPRTTNGNRNQNPNENGQNPNQNPLNQNAANGNAQNPVGVGGNAIARDIGGNENVVVIGRGAAGGQNALGNAHQNVGNNVENNQIQVQQNNREVGGEQNNENNNQGNNDMAGDNQNDDADQAMEEDEEEEQNDDNDEDNEDEEEAVDDDEEDNEDEEEAVGENDDDEDVEEAEENAGDGDEDDANDDENEEENDEQFFDEEEEENQEDPNTPPPYKYWSWSRQYGNPDILRPHPTHTSSMIVGEDGTYLLLLRLAAALPSPLARIKWDQEEEEDRRITRGASRRRSRRQRHGRNRSGTDDDERSSIYGGKEVEEDYFVTVNIEAPLQTVMDSIDESQTHFPLLRAGLWDYRTEEEVLNEDPVFATICAVEIVSLRAGDVLSVNFMNDEISRESMPLPDDAPPELVNSLTLVKVHGNTMARYERLKSAPTVGWQGGIDDYSRRHSDRGTAGNGSSAPGGSKQHWEERRSKCDHEHDEEVDEDSHAEIDHHRHIDHEAEEIDRCLTKTAHWTNPRNDFLPTPFQPQLFSNSTVLQFPSPGHYLLLGRVAVGCRRDAKFLPVLSGGPLEGHRVQLSVRSAGGRLLHAVGAFAFEDRPRLGCSDLSILSENGMFNDVVDVPQSGTELSITTTGDCRLHPEGTEVGPFCSAVSQSLSMLLLDDEMMEVDRYMVGTTRTGDNRREVKWFHTRARGCRGLGGTHSQPSLFDVDGHRLVWRGCLDHFTTNGCNYQDPASSIHSSATILIIGSLPPLRRGYVVTILKNNEPIAISITPESLDVKGRHSHYFQEVVSVRPGDELTIAECAYGEEGERGWSAQLHVEPRMVEFDTRMGHLSFIVLQSDGEVGGGQEPGTV